MASDLERAIRASKRYEAILSKRYSAKGRGLHEKTDSVERKLDQQLVRDLRLIATVRNKLVHQDGYDDIQDEASFEAARKRADKALKTRTGGRPLWPIVVVLVLLGVIALVAFAFLRP